MKSKILSLILCLAVLPAAAVPAIQSAGKNDNARPQYLPIQKLMNTFQVISGYYVDTVNEPHVVDEAITLLIDIKTSITNNIFKGDPIDRT